MLKSRIEECEPCLGCGKSGTWREDGICESCVQDARHRANEAGDEADPGHLSGDRIATLVACGVPRRQARIEFEKPTVWPHDPRRPDLTLDKWTREPWSALLTGPVGSGKTVIAAEMLYRRRCDGETCRYIRASGVPRLYFSGKNREFDGLKSVGLLVLDDFGRGHLGRACEAVGELLAARYDDELPTIITTNFSLQEIAKFDAHIADRLSEGLLIAMLGDSRRELMEASRG
jgi:hypothetical protein